VATIQEITTEIRQFADDREWEQFHTVRNLVLALVGEVGELAAEIQWVKDVDISSHLGNSDNKSRMASEVADIATYLFRLCDVADIDLAVEVRRKLIVNGDRYSVEKSKGLSVKYTEL
jgi:dCTP diphosphatase